MGVWDEAAGRSAEGTLVRSCSGWSYTMTALVISLGKRAPSTDENGASRCVVASW